jgi:hypothetical protein
MPSGEHIGLQYYFNFVLQMLTKLTRRPRCLTTEVIMEFAFARSANMLEENGTGHGSLDALHFIKPAFAKLLKPCI